MQKRRCAIAFRRSFKDQNDRDCHKRGKVSGPLASPQDDFCLEAPFAVAASASLCRFYEDVGRSVSNSYSLESTFAGAEMDRCSAWRAEPIHVGLVGEKYRKERSAMRQNQQSEPPFGFGRRCSWWGRTRGGTGWFRTKRGCAAAFLSIAKQRFAMCDPKTDLSHKQWSWFRAISSST
jgi:hypothetical protein